MAEARTSEDAPTGSDDHLRRLGLFTGRGYSKGRGSLWCAAWVVVGDPLQRSVLCPSSIRSRILRFFGASIGSRTNIRHGVHVHWPWKLSVGDDTWIGVGAWILNLAPVTIGDDVCISQQVMLCTGSHDADDPAFEFDNAPIVVNDGAWLAARATVLRGVTIGTGALVGATTLVVSDVPSRARVLAQVPSIQNAERRSDQHGANAKGA